MPEPRRAVQPESPTEDAKFPSSILAKLARAEARLTVKGMTNEGDIVFAVPMADVGLYRGSVTRAPMAWSGFFLDLAGEVLVRKHISLFADMLANIEPGAYDRTVNCFKHRSFGVVVEDNGELRFQFHISLVQRILTEDVEALLGAPA